MEIYFVSFMKKTNVTSYLYEISGRYVLLGQHDVDMYHGEGLTLVTVLL